MILFILWTIVPYAALATCFAGYVWQYRINQLRWGGHGTQSHPGMLRWGTLLFHLGAFAAIGGHILGLLVPASLTQALGISDGAYHLLSAVAGTLAGSAVVAGLTILLYRRALVPRKRTPISKADVAAYVLLASVIVLGMLETVGVNLLGGGYDYRASVAVWFRGLLLLQPHPQLMAAVPLVFRLHVLAALLFFALWPFTRLVHAWSVPLAYLARPTVLYKRKLPAES